MLSIGLRQFTRTSVIQNVGLEEVRWKGRQLGNHTGFRSLLRRPAQSRIGSVGEALGGPSKGRRDYKVIVLSGKDNRVIEMRNREAMAE